MKIHITDFQFNIYLSFTSKIILRPHIIYGPGDTTIGPRIKNGIKFGYFPVPGNGKNRISLTHVENLVSIGDFFILNNV